MEQIAYAPLRHKEKIYRWRVRLNENAPALGLRHTRLLIVKAGLEPCKWEASNGPSFKHWGRNKTVNLKFNTQPKYLFKYEVKIHLQANKRWQISADLQGMKWNTCPKIAQRICASLKYICEVLEIYYCILQWNEATFCHLKMHCNELMIYIVERKTITNSFRRFK